MVDKLHAYQGWGGRLHEWRDSLRERYAAWRAEHADASMLELLKRQLREQTAANASANPGAADYSHIYRSKQRSELIRVSAAVMGIEFSYAAETAFVSPTLLKIGVQHQHMTLVWALSPLVGFFLTPVLGSVSDKCRLPLGRRRPFIILLALGVLLGLLLVPNGESLGYAFGDELPDPAWQLGGGGNGTSLTVGRRLTTAGVVEQATTTTTTTQTHINATMTPPTANETESNGQPEPPEPAVLQPPRPPSHPWGIFFTILGTVLLDFDADACQSPARAYLLDVCVAEDHAKGLSTFTIMAGLGGFMGYSLGGINWDGTFVGEALGGHVRAVFTLVTFIFIGCVAATVTSFREIPLWRLEAAKAAGDGGQVTNGGGEYIDMDAKQTTEDRTAAGGQANNVSYGATTTDAVVGTELSTLSTGEPQPLPATETTATDERATLAHYLRSILHMPHSMRMICLTNLFCWMAHVCYSLYFTDFVGEAVFGGDPAARPGSVGQLRYEEGVRFGCWGMAMYSLSCACYSLVIERLIARFRARTVYVGGLLFYCAGMSLMAMTRAPASVIVFSWAAGVMYSTLFTMPYLLVAHYHATGTFAVDACGDALTGATEVRGLGTDVAIVSSMVFLAQFILSLCMGTIVTASGTTTAVVSVAAFLSLCGALSATQIMYLEL